MESLQLRDKMTEEDRIHRQNEEQGQTKFTTLQRIRAGSTRSRVSFFEEL